MTTPTTQRLTQLQSQGVFLDKHLDFCTPSPGCHAPSHQRVQCFQSRNLIISFGRAITSLANSSRVCSSTKVVRSRLGIGHYSTAALSDRDPDSRGRNTLPAVTSVRRGRKQVRVWSPGHSFCWISHRSSADCGHRSAQTLFQPSGNY